MKEEINVHLYNLNEARLRVIAKYWEKLLAEYHINNRDMVLLMASTDYEINYYSVLYLNALKNEKNFSKLYILSASARAEACAKKYATVPYVFIKCTEEQSKNLRWLYSIYRFTDQLLINTFEFAADTNALNLIGYKGLSKKDIVAMAFLKMEKVPGENEIYIREEQCRINYRAIDWEPIEKTIVYADDSLSKQHEFYDAGLAPVIENGLINKNDPIVLFGISKVTMYILKRLEEYRIVAIIDNNTQKSGQYIKDIPVYYPEEFLGEYNSTVKILVPSICYKDMCEQLFYLGYEIGKQVFIVHCQNYLPSVSERSINSVLNEIRFGYYEYNQLRNVYEQEHLFLCPYPGTGDIYLIGLYIKKIIEKRNILNYILLVVSKNCEKIANMFGMNVVCITPDVAKAILMYARFMGFENINLSVLNDGYLQRMVPRLRGYAEIDFHTMFRKVVFNVEEIIIRPKWSVENANDLFERFNLKKGKTVLLSPYANTVYKISKDFWSKLAAELKMNGYNVCTNCSSDIEEAIEGTVGLFIPYGQMVDFLDKASGFIALRSGLCDIVSSSIAKKVIFYPEGKTLLNSSAHEYFSLIKMGFEKENLIELEFKKNEEHVLFDKVMNFFLKESK